MRHSKMLIFTTKLTKDAKVRRSKFLNFVLFVAFVGRSVFHTACYASLPKMAAAVQPKFLP